MGVLDSVGTSEYTPYTIKTLTFKSKTEIESSELRATHTHQIAYTIYMCVCLSCVVRRVCRVCAEVHHTNTSL